MKTSSLDSEMTGAVAARSEAGALASEASSVTCVDVALSLGDGVGSASPAPGGSTANVHRNRGPRPPGPALAPASAGAAALVQSTGEPPVLPPPGVSTSVTLMLNAPE